MLLDTTKYDDTLHYRFPVECVYRVPDAIAVYRGPDIVLESYRGSFAAPGHVLNIFFADRYYNIAIMWNRDWSPRMHYVNIASSAQWDDARVTAVDMDLDVLRFAGEDRVIVDDEEEFAEHTRSMRYPEELVSRCRAAADEVLDEMNASTGLYSDSIYDWRPGADLSPYLN